MSSLCEKDVLRLLCDEQWLNATAVGSQSTFARNLDITAKNAVFADFWNFVLMTLLHQRILCRNPSP